MYYTRFGYFTLDHIKGLAKRMGVVIPCFNVEGFRVATVYPNGEVVR